jgi:hypothetical protein
MSSKPVGMKVMAPRGTAADPDQNRTNPARTYPRIRNGWRDAAPPPTHHVCCAPSPPGATPDTHLPALHIPFAGHSTREMGTRAPKAPTDRRRRRRCPLRPSPPQARRRTLIYWLTASCSRGHSTWEMGLRPRRRRQQAVAAEGGVLLRTSPPRARSGILSYQLVRSWAWKVP